LTRQWQSGTINRQISSANVPALIKLPAAMQKPITAPTLDLIDNFPAFDKAGAHLKEIIIEHGYKMIADIGGGANPMLDDEFIANNHIHYSLIDISRSELLKANSLYKKIEADATSDNDTFQKQIAGIKFDLIFSHMFLEHISNPVQAHRNFYSALKPGGRCVHYYASPNNLPLTLNRLLPETISAYLVKIAQPARDLEGSRGKFKAVYKMCGAPNRALSAVFEEIGYTISQHTGYIGHTYYERFKPVAMLERRLRKIIHKLQLPLTSNCLLVLEKRA
jgi:SAM-dependent methyltransferase